MAYVNSASRETLLSDVVVIGDTLLQAEFHDLSVLIIPSERFFMGSDAAAYPAHECIRLSVAASNEALTEGIAIIGRVVKSLYRQEYTCS